MPDKNAAETLTILALGDVVGKPGRQILKSTLPALKKKFQIDFCIANAENAAGGAGLTPDTVEELLQAGVDVLTGGDHVFDKKELIPLLQNDVYAQRVLRPANYSPEAAGQGYTLIALPHKTGLYAGVLHLSGRTFMKLPADCPFRTADRILAFMRKVTPLIFVDFHGEATSEKVAMGWYLNGRVSCVFGTHTHVPTADERILSQGTAYITDVGMTGPYDSVIGRETEKVLHALLTGMPTRFDVAEKDARLGAVLVSCEAATGWALSIRRLLPGDYQEFLHS